jgi:hypothetical protein
MRIAAAAALFVLTASLEAATFTVSTTADSGPGSLRQAIAQANATPGKDTIAFPSPAPTIALASPLPPIADSVVMSGFALDGTGAGSSASALTIQADDVELGSVTVTNFGGDGLVLAGRRAKVRAVRAVRCRTGIRVSGAENEIDDFHILQSSSTGLVFTTGSSANRAGRYLDPTIVFVVAVFEGGEVRDGLADGVVLDGTHNALVNATVDANGGDGIVAGGALNRLAFSEASFNGGNGVTLFAPVVWSSNRGSCNAKVFVDVRGDGATLNDLPDTDGVVNAPVGGEAIAAKFGSEFVTFFDGTLDAAANVSYQIDVIGFDALCPSGSSGHEPFVVTTDAAGHVVFHHALHGNPHSVALTATRLLGDGTPGGGTSELSAPMEVAPFVCDPICQPSADLSIEALDLPASVRQGDTVTLRLRIANHGWFAAADAGVEPTAPLTGATAPTFDFHHEPDGHCGTTCGVEGLAAGESVVLLQTLAVTGAPGTQLTEQLHVSATLAGVDPVSANDTVSISIPIVAPANVPTLSAWALALMGIAVAIAGWRIVR